MNCFLFIISILNVIVVTRSMLKQVISNSMVRKNAIVFYKRHSCLSVMCISSILSCVVMVALHMYPHNTLTAGGMTTQEARIIPGVKDIPACKGKQAHEHEGNLWSHMKVLYI